MYVCMYVCIYVCTEAERLMYLPSLGYCGLLAHLLHAVLHALPQALCALPARLRSPAASLRGRPLFYSEGGGKQGEWGWQVARGVLVLAVSVAYGRLTWVRNRAWRDYESLFSAAAAVCPRSAKVQYNLAHMQAGKGDMVAAEAHYRHAILIHPAYYQALANLGSQLARGGRRDEATELYERAVSAKPSLGEAYYNLAWNLGAAGDSSSALAYMRTAASLQPTSAEIAHGYANALRTSGQVADALALYQRSVALDPEFTSAYNNIAACLLALASASPPDASSVPQTLLQARKAYLFGSPTLSPPPFLPLSPILLPLMLLLLLLLLLSHSDSHCHSSSVSPPSSLPALTGMQRGHGGWAATATAEHALSHHTYTHSAGTEARLQRGALRAVICPHAACLSLTVPCRSSNTRPYAGARGRGSGETRECMRGRKRRKRRSKRR
jgi:tetratricopeptide (TPR) repeat protein